MSILDDAIREHLELKRAHGADAAELKKLEDEAFGPPQRPDQIEPFAMEAPTALLGSEGAPAEAETTVEELGGRRVPNIADLQEPPEPPAPVEEPQAELPIPEAPEAEAPTPAPEAPAVEEQPAMEHQTIPEPAAEAPAAPPEPAAPEPEPEPPADAGPSTEERHAIAEQPTEFFDVEAEMEEAPPATAPAPVPAPEPEIADEPVSEEYEEDDFFSEQRLSDELDQALEAPVTEEHEVVAEPEEAEEAEEEPISEEYEEGEYETGEEEHEPPAAPRGQQQQHDDLLEDKPDFLEDEEDDDLWFEQRPPKDFDFDD